MFGRATIRLGIGPHSSFDLNHISILNFFSFLLSALMLLAGQHEGHPGYKSLLHKKPASHVPT